MWKTIYDISTLNYFQVMLDDKFDLYYTSIVLIVFIFSVFELACKNNKGSRGRKIAAFIIMFIFLSFAIYTNVKNYNLYLNLRHDLENNKCRIAEGDVINFVPYHEHSTIANESFEVDGINFKLYGTAPGYHILLSRGGKISPGSFVKIYYKQDSQLLARVDVLER
jgi:hypothetical protein